MTACRSTHHAVDPGAGGKGTARRCRQQHRRSLARRLCWLLELRQAVESHHTAPSANLGTIGCRPVQSVPGAGPRWQLRQLTLKEAWDRAAAHAGSVGENGDDIGKATGNSQEQPAASADFMQTGNSNYDGKGNIQEQPLVSADFMQTGYDEEKQKEEEPDQEDVHHEMVAVTTRTRRKATQTKLRTWQRNRK